MQHQHSKYKQLQLWYCGDCSGFHLRTDHVSLTLSNAEFEQLSKTILEMHGHSDHEPKTEQPETVHETVSAKVDDVLDSDLIA